jgi:dienelactone hydrolase
LLGRWMHERERHHSQRDKNRLVRPFEWGAEFIREHANGDDPRRIFEEHSREVLSRSEEFYLLPEVEDFKLAQNVLTWTSAIKSPSPENNLALARFFPAKDKNGSARRAVLVLPQWNAQPESHIELCRVLNRLGISALRLTMPYHEERRPAEMERADHLVSSNIGRTIQSVRQAVLDARAAARWLLEHQGYERVGIIGTSIGSCTAFLAFAHEERIKVGVFNHVSGYFADVVWRGISTQHVREGFGDEVTLEELRRYWLPISPLPFIPHLLKQKPRSIRFIAARYDLTFPVDLSRDVIRETRAHGIAVDVAWLPCGHYTSGEKPWVYLDGWKIATFFRKHL